MLKTRRSFVAFSDVKKEFLISRRFALDSSLFLTEPYYHTFESYSLSSKICIYRILVITRPLLH